MLMRIIFPLKIYVKKYLKYEIIKYQPHGLSKNVGGKENGLEMLVHMKNRHSF